MDYTTLPTIAVLSDKVTIVEIEQVKCIRVIDTHATAIISLHGGHIISFKPTDQPDLLWMSDDTIFDGKAALRGGIPVCWPWFARVATPSHGFARTSDWQLIEHRENDNGVIIELGLLPTEQTLAIWPHQFQASLFIEVGNELKVNLAVTNTDDHEWRFSGALHSYLNVADILQTTTTGMGSEYIDSLQDNAICQGSSELQLTATIDRVYTQPESLIALSDPQYQRSIHVENQGANAAVLWNPWAEGAKSMADMNDDGYKNMMCIESVLHASSLETGKCLQPGESHQLMTTISSHA